MTRFLPLLPLVLLPAAILLCGAVPDGKSPRIRVLLAEECSRGTLRSDEPLHLFRPGEKAALRVMPPVSTTDVSCREGRIRIGRTPLPPGEILLVPESSGAVRWNGKAYHGSILLRPVSRERFHAINIVGMEDYITGVLPAEMGVRAPIEALKAQAVAARTYAYAQRKERTSSRFDVYADVRDQVYGGIPANPVFRKATRATRGLLLVHGSGPFKAYFHSTCGGRTGSVASWRGDPEIAPLAGSPCGFCGGAKWYRWNANLSRAELDRALRNRTGSGEIDQIRIRKRNDDDRIGEVSLRTGSHGKFIIPGAEFRTLLGANLIRSTRWIVTPSPTGWAFLGKGWGHGVGLCQEGAMGMAKEGYGHRKILSRYYPGAALREFYR
jgi:stage II sporulation protein D